MGRSWTDLSTRGIATVCGLISLTACSGKSTEAQQAPSPDYVVLSITSQTGGTIDGALDERDSEGRKVLGDLSLPSPRTLADAVLFCGPTLVKIDTSWTHTSYVSFPSSKGDRQSDLEIVRCVQNHIGFAFSAGIGSAPKPGESYLELDCTPFSSLQSRRKFPSP